MSSFIRYSPSLYELWHGRPIFLTLSVVIALICGACVLLSMTGAQGERHLSPMQAGYYLKDGSGKAVYLAGYPSVYLVDRPGGGGYQSMHSALQQYGVNKYRAWPLHGWFRYSDVVAGKREIVYNVNSAGKADLTSFNTRTLGDLRNAVADAGSKGIYVEISLFDDCSLEADSTYRWNAHPFNARNNVNGVFNFGESADNGSGFYNVNNPTLLYYQRLYVDKILEYTAGYDNVIYEVINEGSSYGSGAWDKYWVDYLKSKVGNKVAVNHDYTDYAAAGDGKVDMLNYHGYCVPAEWDLGSRPDYIRSRVSPYWGIKPQNYDEGPNMEDSIASGDYKYVRRMMWGSLTNASYFEINDNEPWNTGNPAYLDGKVLGYIKALTDTVKASSFGSGNMVPNRGILAGKPGGTVYAEALAESGKSYIIYLWGNVSGGNLTVNLPAGTYDARWINPSNGQTVKTQTVNGSSAAAIAAPAFSEDVALLLCFSSVVRR